jgi:hypothetical protein
MDNRPVKQRERAHAQRRKMNLIKEFLKFKDGKGKFRAERARSRSRERAQ